MALRVVGEVGTEAHGLVVRPNVPVARDALRGYYVARRVVFGGLDRPLP